MPTSTQWTHVPTGASGSSTMRTRLFVPAGDAVHSSGGETSGPSPVYLAGIIAPAPKAGLVSAKPAMSSSFSRWSFLHLLYHFYTTTCASILPAWFRPLMQGAAHA